MKPRRTDPEVLRCLRLGDLRSLFRSRYGPVLPDDDAGRADLNDMLCVISTAAVAANSKMANAIETLAPWMPRDEAEAAIDYINRMPMPARNLSRFELGKRQMVTNEIRERLGLRQIWPVDMTTDQMMERRKVRRRANQRRYRLKKGAKPRTQYEGKSIAKAKPWVAEGICRRTWYYRRGTNTLPKLTCTSALPEHAGLHLLTDCDPAMWLRLAEVVQAA